MSDHPRIRVAAVITKGESVLLCEQRKHDRSYWLMPGGGVEAGETLLDALRRELQEETGLVDVLLAGPIAIVESIAPAGTEPRKHVVHILFHGDAAGLPLDQVASDDGSIHSHRLVARSELAGLDLRPPISRFLERWRPGDPFVHLGELWTR